MPGAPIKLDPKHPRVVDVRNQSPVAYDDGFEAYWRHDEYTEDEYDLNPYEDFTREWCSFSDGWSHASELDEERSCSL